MPPPPWLLWFNSVAGYRGGRRRQWPGPHTGYPGASAASAAGPRRRPTERPYPAGRSHTPLPASRAGHRRDPGPRTRGETPRSRRRG
jgi:hypothetical protein